MNTPVHAAIKEQQLHEIVQGAGDILLRYFRTPVKWHEKGRNSIVTEADIASERYLIEKLTALLPASCTAEESGKSDQHSENGYRWVIDPLDGTTNFASGIPYFCISVALTLYDKPVIGCVYQPLLKEFFFARSGGGAWLNGKKIQVHTPTRLEDAVIVQAYSYSVDTVAEQVARMARVAHEVRSVRVLGAVALDVAYVAAGFIEGTFFEGTAWWDVAAAMLILQEAGGVCSEYSKSPIGPQYTTFCGAGPFVYEHLMALLAKKCN